MSAWVKRVGAMTLFVEDLARAKAFYQDVFGLPVTYEDASSAVFTFDNTLVNLLQTSAAHELIEPATVAGPETGSRFQLTIWVDDVDAVCLELQTLGVALINGPMDRAWGQRTATFADPGGHVWEIAQELPASQNT
jgi:catechol 2,3-dioxygenase-like lactoylglutathione lyase family enzyme